MIRLENISKIYGEVIALENINIHFKEGELVVLKGASGSGKSSILSLISAISKPSEGKVIVDKKEISKLADHFSSVYRRDNIGFIFQRYNLIPSLSVRDNIILPLVPKNLKHAELEDKLQKVMKTFAIEHKENIIVKNLSGGEQQRVAIARANVNEPKIILADEPTANLDEKLSLSFIANLQKMKDAKKTIIVATHDPLFFDLDIVDRYIELKNGRVV